jgi:acetyl esterase/lipase
MKRFLLLVAIALLAAVMAGASRPYIADATPRQHLDVYPADADEPGPAIVFVHGGGFRLGNREVARRFADTFTNAGVTVISVGYRLVPEGAWPENTKDLAAGLAHVFEHVEELGVDPERITLMGHSAGAHLVAEVATDPRWLGEHDLSPNLLHGVVLLDGACYDVADSMRLGGPRMRRGLIANFGERADDWRAASPTLNVTDQSTHRWLAVLADGRGRSGEATAALFEQVEAAGGETRTLVAPGENHAQVLRTLADPADAEAVEILKFVR